MTLRLKEHALTIAVVVTTTVIIVFAGLQYRWSNEVTEATGVRLADTLQMSMVNWHLDFLRNFSEVGRALRPSPRRGDGDLEWYAQQFEEWQALARYPTLVSGLYVIDVTSTPLQAQRLDASTRRFEPAASPRAFVPAPPAPRRVPSGIRDEDDVRAGDPPADWQFDPRTPALLRPISPRDGLDVRRWLVIELDATVIRDRILPDLAHRYFQGTDGLDYEVAVAAGPPPRRVLYASDVGFGVSAITDADGTLNVFGRSRQGTSESPLEMFQNTSLHKGPATAAISWFPLSGDAPQEQDWRLVVRHRRGGPLGAFIANTHRRDLGISFAALLLLVVSIAMLVVASTRAQRLAALQMDFVTAVSHELRTPLAVISSAADNIAQGVVEGRDQLTRYGSVIGNQVRQLSTLVEQILLFATQSKNPQRFSLQPLAVTDIIEATMASTEGLIRASHFTLECDIDPALPNVMGDLVALSQCLQNLITNALKYARDQRWIGIRAGFAEGGATGREIQIAVADHGIGITRAELPHIFEPFYRSPAVAAAQIHGTGLGLSLARGIAEAMGGRLTVRSEPGRGSTFTLHLPCVAAGAMDEGAELNASPARRASSGEPHA